MDPRGDGAITTIWDLVNQVNGPNFAGHADWRIPTRDELASVVDLGVPDCGVVPCVDPIVGPTGWFYWSADSFDGNPSAALAIVFENGATAIEPKEAGRSHVRLVR